MAYRIMAAASEDKVGTLALIAAPMEVRAPPFGALAGTA
jgi:hypothetical protein